MTCISIILIIILTLVLSVYNKLNDANIVEIKNNFKDKFYWQPLIKTFNLPYGRFINYSIDENDDELYKVKHEVISESIKIYFLKFVIIINLVKEHTNIKDDIYKKIKETQQNKKNGNI